jgi:CubicO group peptidase (beta-lactamase class C family)
VVASHFENCWRRFRRYESICIATTLVFVALCSARITNSAEVVFPGAEWQAKAPAELELGEERLAAVAQALGSRGCAIKNGYVVKTWGAQDVKGDLYSSAKPVLSTLLMFAVKEGKVKDFDQRLVDFEWPLEPKDRTMSLRHLASMTSGYARPEEPGKAWAYNDYAIQLYQQTLFDKVFKAPPDKVFHHPQRFGALQLQDGLSFRQKNRRMSASVRDFARIAWFWLNRGNWSGKQLLPRSYFDENMRPQVSKDLALSSDAPTNDYLHIGTYGGESNHFSKAGPGIYGFNWWFNAKGASHPNKLTWPDAPRDTVMSLGLRGNCSAMIPSLKFVVVAADANWGVLTPGEVDSPLNQHLRLIAAAGTPLNQADR